MTLTQAVGLALGGLPLGAMYALQAMGIVLVYKTSGVFNFAQGAIGMTAAFAVAGLGTGWGLPLVVAVPAGLLLGAAIGVVMERLTIRPVQGSLQRTVVTLGWLIGLQGVVELVAGTSAGREYVSLFSSAPAFTVDALFLAIAWDQLGVVVVAVAVAAALGIFFRTRAFGVAMRAVADAPEGARLLGIDVNRVTIVSWALGAGMAALSGILVTPLLGKLDTVSLVIFTIQALAAALVGRLTSLPLTFAGGIALGMTQPVAQRLFSLGAGANELIALLFVLGALLLRRRSGRGDSGGGGLAPVPLDPMPRGRVALASLAGIALVLLLQLSVAPPGSFSRAVAGTAVWSLGVLSIVLLSGVAGQVSLCQAAFMGIGGFGAAIGVSAGLPFVAALVAGGLLAAVAAAIVGLPALRLRGLELAIATLSLAFAFDRYFFSSFTPLISPAQKRELPRPEWADRLTEIGSASGPIAVTDWRPYAALAIVVLVGAAWGVASLRRGRTGAAFTALRSSEAATSAMGFSVVGVKLRGFALSGFVAGLGGGLFAGLTEVAGGTAFGFDRSIMLLAYGVIAGLGSVPGAVVGGGIVTLSTLSFGGAEGQVADGSGALVTVVTAVVLVLVLVLAPQGLAGLLARGRDAVWSRRRRLRGSPTDTVVLDDPWTAGAGDPADDTTVVLVPSGAGDEGDG